jgi:hypothetical protein
MASFVVGRNLALVLVQENNLRGIFKKPPLTINDNTKEEDAEAIFQILECHLSPEFLTCDGERPPREVKALYTLYTNAWRELEGIVGHTRECVT